MIRIASALRKPCCLLTLLLLASGLTAARAQSGSPSGGSVNVAGGTLSWTDYISNGISCGPGETYSENYYTAFGFKIGGTAYLLTGSQQIDQSNYSGSCPNFTEPSSLTFTLPNTNGTTIPAGNCTYTFSSGGGYLSCPALNTSSFYPAYKIESILYSPPGNQSWQGYADTTTDASTTTIGNSFTSANSTTFSMSYSTSVPPNQEGMLYASSATTAYTTSSGNSTAFTTTFTDATGLQSDDNSNTLLNPTGTNVLNHNLDEFVFWLNPYVSVTSAGTTPISYTVHSTATAGISTPIADIIPPIPAVTMLGHAVNGGLTGYSAEWVPRFGLWEITTVPVSDLIPQAVATESQVNAYMPGLGAICAATLTKGSSSLYAQQLAADLANPNNPAQICTQANQCGCVPSDFSAILAMDPLLQYDPATFQTTPFSGTIDPMDLDASGTTTCGENPIPTGADCRYVAVPIEPGSTTPQIVSLNGTSANSYLQTDSTTSELTTSASSSYTTGVSMSVGWLASLLHLGSSSQQTWTWTDSESTRTSSSQGNTMNVFLKTSTLGCAENVNIYEDTLYHSFVFQVPTGIVSCP
ncbi:MAG: hypothetical protein ACLP7O_02985 [Terracidiphilus sp.]